MFQVGVQSSVHHVSPKPPTPKPLNVEPSAVEFRLSVAELRLIAKICPSLSLGFIEGLGV